MVIEGSTTSYIDSAFHKIKERATVLKAKTNKLHRYVAKVPHLKMKELEVLQRQNLYLSSLNLRGQDDLRERLDEALQRVRMLEGRMETLMDGAQQINLQVDPLQSGTDVAVDSESPGV